MGDGGEGPAFGALIGGGEIEGPEEVGKVLAVHQAIDTAAAVIGVVGDVHGRATDGRIEAMGEVEEGIAHGLEVEAASGVMAEEEVFGIDAALVGGGGGGLLVGGAEEELAMEGFEAPTGVDELAGQPVEELGVGWWFGAGAEVGGGGDEGLAEVMHPDAIDEDAGGEGVVGGGDGVGQFASAAALGERLGIALIEDAEEAAGGGTAGARGIAAAEHAGFVRLRQVGDHHGSGGRGQVGVGGDFVEVKDQSVVAIFFGAGEVIGGIAAGEPDGAGGGIEQRRKGEVIGGRGDGMGGFGWGGGWAGGAFVLAEQLGIAQGDVGLGGGGVTAEKVENDGVAGRGVGGGVGRSLKELLGEVGKTVLRQGLEIDPPTEDGIGGDAALGEHVPGAEHEGGAKVVRGQGEGELGGFGEVGWGGGGAEEVIGEALSKDGGEALVFGIDEVFEFTDGGGEFGFELGSAGDGLRILDEGQ